MASIQNRSRIVVRVKNLANLTRAFPFDALDAVQAYVDELRRIGYKPTAKQEEDTWEVRIRRKGSPSQSVTFRSRKQAETCIKKVGAELSTGLIRDYTKAHRITFAQLLVRYMQGLKKKSAQVIAYKIEG